jgi:hypothetical protein
MFCSNCGANDREDATHCVICGKALVSPLPPTSRRRHPGQHPPMPRPHSRSLATLLGLPPLPPVPWTRVTLWALAVLIPAFWIGRNLPIYPLSLLAP